MMCGSHVTVRVHSSLVVIATWQNDCPNSAVRDEAFAVPVFKAACHVSVWLE